MTILNYADAVDLGHGRGRARADAAASIKRIDRQLGRPADINEAWRSPEQANANRARWIAYQQGRGPKAPYALGAEDSVHCEGTAADTDDHRDARAAAVWRDNGWRQTARYSDSRDEPWHWEYFAHLDNHRHETDTDDMPDMNEIINSPARTVQGGRKVSLGDAIEAIYYYGDKLYELANSTPGRVWNHGLPHPLLTDAEGKTVNVTAGDFVRFEPAEHANTRAAIARTTVGGVDLEQLKAEIARDYPAVDVHALAVAAADEADRRDAEEARRREADRAEREKLA